MIIVDQEEVIEVSSYLPCRIHRRIEVKLLAVREWREDVRQYGGLYLGSHVHLVGHKLTLPLLTVLFFDYPKPSANEFLQKEHEQDDGCDSHADSESRLLIEGFFLDDRGLQGLAFPAHSILQFHDKCVFAAL